MFSSVFLLAVFSVFTPARWDVGDFQEREISLGQVVYSAVTLSVRAEEGNAYWLVTDSTFIPPLRADTRKEVLIERESGRALRTIVDGKELFPPAPLACEVLSEAPERITVRAGTFETLRRSEKCGRDVFVSWKNEALINMNGEALRALLHSGSTDPRDIYLKTELIRFGRR